MKTYFVDQLTFQSNNSFYKLMTDSIDFDYEYWEAKCSGKKNNCQKVM